MHFPLLPARLFLRNQSFSVAKAPDSVQRTSLAPISGKGAAPYLFLGSRTNVWGLLTPHDMFVSSISLPLPL
jgi:hypothetical protein